ncbi:MAG: S8 family serine peptidase [Armatimonadetes bacterium]|nr:S8 family serine peptidase [Armatimonadota bacterium]
MKNRIVTAALMTIATSQFAFGAGSVIARLRPNVDEEQVKIALGLGIEDSTPFDRFILIEVPDTFCVENVEAMLENLNLAEWATEQCDMCSPGHSEAPKSQGRLGGKIAAVFGSAVMNELNSTLMQQIRYQYTPFTSSQRTVRVGVLDTGFSSQFPKLSTRFAASYNAFNGEHRAIDQPERVDSNGSGTYDDAVGHGTFVTGLILALAPNASIVNVKVADADGIATSWSIIKGLTFAKANGCEIVNLSFGSLDEIPGLDKMIDWCDENGITVVAPSGNDALSRLLYPAKEDKVISVGSVDSKDRKSPWSNFSSRLKFSAPGENLVSTFWDGDLVSWSGTSFANAVVTGVIADRMRSLPVQSSQNLRRFLYRRGVNINPVNPNFIDKVGVRIDWPLMNQR